jgi:protein TonB
MALLDNQHAVDVGPRFADERAATPLDAPSPLYPAWERQQACEGDVLVRYTVLPSGDVADVSASDSSAFAASAAAAVKHWRFEPATRNGAPIATRRTSRFKFRLAAASL